MWNAISRGTLVGAISPSPIRLPLPPRLPSPLFFHQLKTCRTHIQTLTTSSDFSNSWMHLASEGVTTSAIMSGVTGRSWYASGFSRRKQEFKARLASCCVQPGFECFKTAKVSTVFLSHTSPFPSGTSASSFCKTPSKALSDTWAKPFAHCSSMMLCGLPICFKKTPLCLSRPWKTCFEKCLSLLTNQIRVSYITSTIGKHYLKYDLDMTRTPVEQKTNMCYSCVPVGVPLCAKWKVDAVLPGGSDSSWTNTYLHSCLGSGEPRSGTCTFDAVRQEAARSN